MSHATGVCMLTGLCADAVDKHMMMIHATVMRVCCCREDVLTMISQIIHVTVVRLAHEVSS